jgi:hypothetical protein
MLMHESRRFAPLTVKNHYAAELKRLRCLIADPV